MSQATPPKDDTQPALTAPVTPAPVAPPAKRGNGLAAVALLIGAAGVAVGGWSVWQVRLLQSQDQQQLSQLEQARSQTQLLSQREQGLTERLAALPDAQELESRRRLLAQLQGDQQHLSQRVESVLGASRQDWRLAEAEHLMRLAALRLSALQDVGSATVLVQGADEILRDQDDTAAYAAREQLAKTLVALKGISALDRTGLFLQLGAMREQAAQLSTLVPAFSSKGEQFNFAAEGDGQGWWAEWLEKLSRYIRIDFHADQNVRPLLAGQSLTQVRLALTLALEQAQWAALNGKPEVYRQAMTQARGVLESYFNAENPDSRALLARINELIDQPVAVAMPDLAPATDAVRAYVQRRENASQKLHEEQQSQADQPAADEELEDVSP
ncbi:MAG: uroporphyrinogen-III C-methyltransferase [Pseudomonas sp.]